jgi:hypothetical protein
LMVSVWDAVAIPDPVTVTVALAVAVVVGTYDTLIVQLLPGLRRKPLTQVPPAGLENVPAVLALVTVGVALNENAPVAVAALVTVIVPVFVVVLPGVVTNAGEGAVATTGPSVSVAPRTVNVVAGAETGVVPIGVTAVTFLEPSAAAGVIVQFAVTVVVPVTTKPEQVTPVPDTLTAVAPVRFAPVRVMATVLPRTPDDGTTNWSVGPTTVKAPVRVPVPDPVVTLTFLAPSVAVVVMVKVAVALSGLKTVKPLTVTPLPLTVEPVAPVKFVPVIVTGTDVPRTPKVGATEVTVGAGSAMMVNPTALLVPPGAVTVMFLTEPVVPAEMVNVALTWLSFTTVSPLTVTPPPPPPETLIAVVPVSPLPKRLIGTVVPRVACVGEIAVSTGPVTVKVTLPVVPPGVVT